MWRVFCVHLSGLQQYLCAAPTVPPLVTIHGSSTLAPIASVSKYPWMFDFQLGEYQLWSAYALIPLILVFFIYGAVHCHAPTIVPTADIQAIWLADLWAP